MTTCFLQADAAVEGTMGTAKEVLDLLASHGAHPCKTFSEIPEILNRIGV